MHYDNSTSETKEIISGVSGPGGRGRMFPRRERRAYPLGLAGRLTLAFLILALYGCHRGICPAAPETQIARPAAERIAPPVAQKIPVELTTHGHTRIDEYFWLRERENPAVTKYLAAENDYTAAAMRHTEALQEKLFEEIVGRISQDDMSAPCLDNGYYYYFRFEEGKEYPVHCRRKDGMQAPEEVLLNVNEMAEGHEYYSVAGLAVSPDNAVLAFGVDTVSRRRYTIHFKDLRTGAILEDRIPDTTGRAAWAGDSRTVFYAVKDETLRPFKIARHEVGTDVSGDAAVFVETDPTFNAGVRRSKSGRYIFVTSHSTLSTEYRFLGADAPAAEFQVLQPREADLEYDAEHLGDSFYIVTNLGARNFRLMKTPVSKPLKENWTEVIPHREEVLLQGIELFDGHMALSERQDGLTRLRIIRLADRAEHYIDFGEETYSVRIGDNMEMGAGILRFEYSSLTTPNSTYEYDMETKEKRLVKREKVLGGFDPAGYESKRLYATARDGKRIPISLVYRKGIERDGNNPLLLYGYGSYGASMDAYFRSNLLSLLDRGFVYAIAHIRGGQEMGRSWYEDGKLLNKKNTFTDFVDCAEFLRSEKFTEPERLFAMGGSAGGLLVGAVINMRPDLFRGVVAAVPWVDVVTTMLDSSIPLTTAEYDEWGDPNDKAYYDYMLSYSPYDNVKAADYPAMLVTAGFHDSQVQYWEPAKWVARLRAMKNDGDVVLLHTNMGAGHGGVSGRFRRFRETALQYAFLLDLAGIRD